MNNQIANNKFLIFVLSVCFITFFFTSTVSTDPCGTCPPPSSCTIVCDEINSSLNTSTQDFFNFTLNEPKKVTVTMQPAFFTDYDLIMIKDKETCPSTSSYDCYPNFGSGSSEQCGPWNLPAGTYHVLVDYESGTTYSLTMACQDLPCSTCPPTEGCEIECGQTLTGLNTSTEQYFNFTLASPARITVNMQPDPFTDYNLIMINDTENCPSTSSYDCYPNLGSGSSEQCGPWDLPIGTYYILVEDISGSGNYSIDLSCIEKVPNGVACTYGAMCQSNLCIEGNCREICSDTYDGQRCSDDMNNYDSDGICARIDGGWECDETESSLYNNDCWNDCDKTTGAECDSNSLAGGYSRDGMCAGPDCCTDEVVTNSECDCDDDDVTTEKQCDNTVTTDGYSADGICVNDGSGNTDENANCISSGEICIDSANGDRYTQGCSNCQDGDPCNIDLTNADFIPDGVCSNGICVKAFITYYDFTSTKYNKAYGASQDTNTVSQTSTNDANTPPDWPDDWGGYEFTDNGYNLINTSNDQRAFGSAGGSGQEPFLRFNFTINESISDIQWVYAKVESYGQYTGGEGAYCYIANFTNGEWTQFATLSTSEATYELNQTSDFSKIIDRNKQLVLLCQAKSVDDNTEGVYIDYVEVLVGWRVWINYYNIETNVTDPRPNDGVEFKTNFTSNVNLAYYIFESNLTGSFQNYTYAFPSNTKSFNATYNGTSSQPRIVYWRFIANNTEGDFNVTPWQTTVFANRWLEVYWDPSSEIDSTNCAESSPCEFIQYSTFDSIGYVTCKTNPPGLSCGSVSATIRYNYSGTNMVMISTNKDDEPFYITYPITGDPDEKWYDITSNEPVYIPPSRSKAAMAYDSKHDITILFGGATKAVGGTLNDTWVLKLSDNPPKWYNVSSANLDECPKSRYKHVMAYDSKNDRTIMFGGEGEYVNAMNDTWAFNYTDKKWYEITPEGSPPERKYSTMVYDSKNEALILFGGTTDGIEMLNDTWILNFTDGIGWKWYNVTRNNSPPWREEHNMAYDSKHDKTILFGGFTYPSTYLNDTWAFNYTDKKWYNITPEGSPSKRYGHGMIYDSESKLTIIFGGTELGAVLNDTWAFNYTDKKWYNITPEGSLSIRYFPAMAYDWKHDKTVLYGGYLSSPTPKMNDTWIFNFTYGIIGNLQSCGSLSHDQQCQLTWIINATGTPIQPRFIDVNFSSSLSPIQKNKTNNAYVEITGTPEIYLTVESIELSYWNKTHWLISDPLDVSPLEGDNRTMNVTIYIQNSTAVNSCIIRIFNSSDSYSNPSLGPFTGTIRKVDSQIVCNSTWNMGYWKNPGAWNVSVNLSDSVSNFTTKNFTYLTLPALSYNVLTINFTGLPGEIVNSINAYPLIMNNTGNVYLNVSINGTDFIGETDESYVIGVENITYNESETGDFITLTHDHSLVFSFFGPREEKYLYFRAYIPLGFKAQYYNNTIEIHRVKS